MFEISLFALCWIFDSGFDDRTTERMTIVMATCSRPVPKIAQPQNVTALSPTDIKSAQEIADLLLRWEQAQQDVPHWSRSHREEFRRRTQAGLNEHSIAAAEQLMGQVEAKWLSETYIWRIVDRRRKPIVLEAIPKDETERLFYSSLRVSLAPEDCLPEQITVVSRFQTEKVVWQSGETPTNDAVQLVHFENDIPPAPSNLVRTASARLE